MAVITASLVVYKSSPEMIQRLLDSVLKEDVVSKFYIVDNSPTDQLKIVIGYNDVVEYIHCPDNPGFGAAHNIAIKGAITEKSKFHAILNPDIYYDDTVITKLVQFMDLNQDVGITMPKVLYPNGSIQRLCKLYPSPVNLIFRRFMPIKRVKDYLDAMYEMHFFDYNTCTEIPVLSGCFMVVNTDIFTDGCSFDPRYFMYLEDFDLCRQVRGSGRRLMYYPNVQIFHEFEKGSHKNNKLLKYHIASAIKYFNKWGWFFDKERSIINNTTYNKLRK